METGLSYDDVCLIPQFSDIESRSEPFLNTMFTKNINIKIPIIAANMDTVIGSELAKVLEKNGSIPIFHRFYPYTSAGTFPLIKLVHQFPEKCFMSVGVGDKTKEIMNLVDNEELKPLGFCVDIAHGHSKKVLDAIYMLKSWKPNLDIIAGNVCTKQAVKDLVNAGADAVKVGIGPGSACTTRKVTAFGRAQFSAVLECSEEAQKTDTPIIADGGIKSSREIVLALAAGASSVMIGGLFAQTYESAGKGKFRGQASAAFQKEFYGHIKNGVPEGISKKVPLKCPAQKLIDELIGGLRSGMTYGGALSIVELQRKAQFERITPNYF